MTPRLYRFFNRLRFGGDNRRDHHDKADQRQSRYDVIAKVLMAAAFRARAVETMDGGAHRAEIPGDPADHLNCSCFAAHYTRKVGRK